ncbi:MAG: TorF family putative porin [Caulobacteraceae bacterium]
MRGLQRFAQSLATPFSCLAFGLCSALGVAEPARAQVAGAQIGGALGLQSDYRYRGISLSSGGPAFTLDLTYDHPSGFYAGVSTIGADLGGRLKSLGSIEYAGYASPRRGGVSWDVGINNQNLAYYRDKRYPLNYSEVYAGVIGDHLSAHLHYSPNYVRPGYNALYAEVDGSLKPAENWRLFAHIGTTAPVGDTDGRRQRYDARVGVARRFGPFEVQASVTGTTPDPPPLTPHGRAAFIVGASWFF